MMDAILERVQLNNWVDWFAISEIFYTAELHDSMCPFIELNQPPPKKKGEKMFRTELLFFPNMYYMD